MKSRHLVKTMGASMAALAAASAVIQAPAALAQPLDAPAAQAGSAPTPAQSSPANPTPAASGPSNPQAQAATQAYADQYARWASANCVDQRTGNTAAGAIVGGALGAITGAALTGKGAGALAGGAVGAVTGAAVGSTAPHELPARLCGPGRRADIRLRRSLLRRLRLSAGRLFLGLGGRPLGL